MFLSLGTDKRLTLTFFLPLNQALYAYNLRDACRMQQGKPLKLSISEIKKQRSLSQNAYAWALMQRMAEQQRTTAEEIYEIMLQRYGLLVLLRIPPGQEKALDLHQLKLEQRILREGKEYHIFSGIIGSSKYDTEQMTRFLDGVVSECREMGIDTEIPDALLL